MRCLQIASGIESLTATMDVQPAIAGKSIGVTLLTPRKALGICTGLLLVFGFLSYFAACTKCATYDETLHAPAGYTYLRYFDFRANPEHPPLWKYWEALPWLIWSPATMNVDSSQYVGICDDITNQWAWAQRTMYDTPANNPARLLAMSRFMMVILSVGCGAMLAWWAYRAAGSLAAVIACSLYALDPNFLAHGSLVTNDVAFCLAILAFSYVLWKVGEHLTLVRAIGLAVLCGVAITTKFTGVLVAPILIVSLVARAVMPTPWLVFRKTLTSRWHRFVAAAGICVFAAVVTYGWIWLAYGFRFQTAPDPNVHPNMEQMVAEVAVDEIMSETGHPATREQIHAWQPSLYPRMVFYGLQHRLFPSAFLNGLLFAYSKSLFRYSFLMGDVYGTGRWYYFPVAALVKTPIATLVTVGLAGVLCMAARRKKMTASGRWLMACLGIAPLIVGIATMRSHMNIGIRHILPVYVYLYAIVGIVLARMIARRARAMTAVFVVLLLALMAESFVAFPNYIAYFNIAAGGSRGGIYLLGDSNLDWGQDLPLLAKWRLDHPERDLHVAYFGTAKMSWYNIRGESLTQPNGQLIAGAIMPTSGWLAVSATTLQGINDLNRRDNPFASLLKMRPAAVLGGSIYVYDLGGQ